MPSVCRVSWIMAAVEVRSSPETISPGSVMRTICFSPARTRVFLGGGKRPVRTDMVSAISPPVSSRRKRAMGSASAASPEKWGKLGRKSSAPICPVRKRMKISFLSTAFR